MRKIPVLSTLLAMPLLLGNGLPFGEGYVRAYVVTRLSEMAGRELRVEGEMAIDLAWKSSVRLEDVRVANAAWGRAAHLLELEALVITLDMRRLLRGEVRLPRLRLVGPKLFLEVSETGTPNWLLGGRDRTIVESAAAPGGEVGNLPRIDRLEVTGGELAFLNQASGSRRWVRGRIDQAAGHLNESGAAFSAAGTLGGEAYAVMLRAAPLDDLRAGEEANPIELLATAGRSRLVIEGTAVSPFALSGIDLSIEASGRGFDRLPFGGALPASPPFDLSARLRRETGPWEVEDLDASIGRNRMRGRLRADLSGGRPRIAADLAAETIAVGELLSLVPPGAAPGIEPGVVREGVDLSGLEVVDAQVEVTAEEVLFQDLRLAEVRASLTIEDGVLILAPISAAAGGGRARTHLALSPDPLQASARIELDQVSLAEALRHDPGTPPLGTLDGSIALVLPPPGDPAAQTAERIGPQRVLQRLRIEEGRLSYREPHRATNLVLALGAGPAFAGPRVHVGGQWRGVPVRADLSADPLPGLTAAEPYSVDGRLSLDEAEARVVARLLSPPELQELWLRFDLAGTPKALGELTGIALQGVPPLEASAILRRSGRLWHARELDLQVGGSDLAGQVRIDRAPARPRLEVALHSQTLDLTTLLPEGTRPPPGEGAPFQAPPFLGEARGRLSYEAGEVITAGPRISDLSVDARLGEGTLRLSSARASYRDAARETRLDLVLAPAEAGRDLAGDIDGRLFGSPFAADLRAAARLGLAESSPPGAWHLRIARQDTELRLSGQVRDLRSPEELALDLSARGPSAAELSDLIGAALPTTPDYRLSARLERDGSRLMLEDLNGRIGRSDVSGRVAADLANRPPDLNARLVSDRLVYSDLASVLSRGPESEREQLFSDRPLGLKQLGQGLQGRLRYRARDFVAGRVPLQGLRLDARLRDGHLSLSPLRVGLGGGRVRLKLELDTNAAPPEADLQGEIARVHMGRVLERFAIADSSAGTLGGQLQLWLHGESLAEMAGSADGGLFLVMTGRALDRLLVEAAGLDIGEAALALLSEDQVPLDCAYLNLQSRDGQADIETLAVDTRDTLFVGGGQIDLEREHLELVIEARPKDWSLPAFSSPLRWQGPLTDPELQVLSSELIGRTIATIGLAALQPLLGLIPLIESGPGAESPYCTGLIETLREARR